MLSPMSNNSNILPVGISFSNYYANNDRVSKKNPIIRVSAHITIKGKSEAKHFLPHKVGMVSAIESAVAWREKKVKKAIRKGVTSGKLNVGGVRKSIRIKLK